MLQSGQVIMNIYSCVVFSVCVIWRSSLGFGMLIEGLAVIRVFTSNFHRPLINRLVLIMSAMSLHSNKHAQWLTANQAGMWWFWSLSVIQYKVISLSFCV